MNGPGMAAHQIYYLKIDRSLLNPHASADWATSMEKATFFGSEPENVRRF
jgi:hypothetical protein